MDINWQWEILYGTGCCLRFKQRLLLHWWVLIDVCYKYYRFQRTSTVYLACPDRMPRCQLYWLLKTIFSDSHYIKGEHHSYFDSSAIPNQQASALPIMLTRRVCSLATRRPPTLPTRTAALQVHCEYFSRRRAASQAMMPNSPRLRSS